MVQARPKRLIEEERAPPLRLKLTVVKAICFGAQGFDARARARGCAFHEKLRLSAFLLERGIRSLDAL